MANPTELNIAVIVCSQRVVRVGPSVTDFVYSALEEHLSTRVNDPCPGVKLNRLDLSDWSLPLFDEPVVPQMIRDPAGYHHQHTRDWSVEISKYNAFVFVTPQYNWGYPASVKNAIDYLFNEWAGKKAMVVSYGGHGGGKAGAQLKQVLMGTRMQVCEKAPELVLGSEGVKSAGLEGKLVAPWDETQKKMIAEAFEELLVL